jgi:hypothetical protein
MQRANTLKRGELFQDELKLKFKEYLKLYVSECGVKKTRRVVGGVSTEVTSMLSLVIHFGII